MDKRMPSLQYRFHAMAIAHIMMKESKHNPSEILVRNALLEWVSNVTLLCGMPSVGPDGEADDSPEASRRLFGGSQSRRQGVKGRSARRDSEGEGPAGGTVHYDDARS